ncbi:MAG TPA: hypothetical protein VKT82_28675 [Ktedonobacterales bacterium]|nr:hypothetical protein [Ktedonobacterales bacterium]
MPFAWREMTTQATRVTVRKDDVPGVMIPVCRSAARRARWERAGLSAS